MAEPEKRDGDDGATWVESGGFKVDRARALEKLGRFQLAEPALFLLPWVRAAVAAGASQVGFRTLEDGVEMRFDGRAFAPSALEDPLGALFEKERKADPARRGLALGLVACLRLPGCSVSLDSGAGPERGRARLGEEKGAVELLPHDAETDTVLRVSGLGPELARAAIARVRGSCPLSPVPILVDGSQAAPEPAEEGEPHFPLKSDRFRGRMRVPDSPGSASVLELCVGGVRVQTLEYELPKVQVRCLVNDDALRLDASLSGVIRNERFKGLVDELGWRSEKFALFVSERLSERMPVLGKRLLEDASFRRRWRRLLASSSSSLRGGLFRSLLFRLERLFSGGGDAGTGPGAWEARAVLWLRGLCGSTLADLEDDAASPVSRTLWNAPLFFSCAGKPLSLADLEARHKRLGKLLYSVEAFPGRAGGEARGDILWLAGQDALSLLLARYTMEDAT